MSICKFPRGLPPIFLPVLFFGVAILIGAVLLHQPISLAHAEISWTNALFTATSAACVTGLTVVDTGTSFSRFGQTVILILIQLGGLGIMTFTSLAFYLVRQQVSLTDKIAVGQALIPHNRFALGDFLKAMFLGTMLIEGLGGLALYTLAPAGSFNWFSALFHSISAFCNAGFSLNSNSLVPWRGNWPINLIIMFLIICGGLGFSVLIEMRGVFLARIKFDRRGRKRVLSWYAGIVIKTSLLLIVVGWAAIFMAEFIGFHRQMPLGDAVLSSLFQSVPCRTAGFNSMDIHNMTNVSLFVMVILMFIGGAPGSCAGGIKVTTFRTIYAFITSQLKGRRRAKIGKFAIEKSAINNALILLVLSVLIIFTATLILSITEGGDLPHPQTRGQVFEILFETVSAFGTVGLSTGLTPHLSLVGKWLITALMFIGRLGPLVFLAGIQAMRKEEFFELPEEDILIG